MSPLILSEARNFLVKGCAPQIYREGEEFPIDAEGPVNQRRWMVVDRAKEIFRSQRHPGFSGLARIRPQLAGTVLTLRAEGMPDCAVPLDEPGELTTATIWDADCPVRIHPDASRWVSEYMRKDLLFSEQAGRRPVNSIYAPEDATVGFADRFPLTALSEETVEHVSAVAGETVDAGRFRYNLLFRGCMAQAENCMARFRIGDFIGRSVKPSDRCTEINVNQQTGEPDMELLDLLKKHPWFRNPHNHAAIVAENVIVERPGTVTVGSPVEVLEWSEQGWDRPFQLNHRQRKKIGNLSTTQRSVGPDGVWRWLRGK
ncbi:MAG: MOSC domain-containing protein [Candidatus Peregrinibacteria bacterium Greene0416_19]|nr:MAG: MOSC domain-containing protein [Candidatus Peregrinibacteria bacterium Greene0416_19]